MVLFFSIHLTAQVGIGTINPHTTAALDIASNYKGLLIPRLTTTERNLITAPATGLIIYNSTKNCIEFFNGTTWGFPVANELVKKENLQNLTTAFDGILETIATIPQSTITLGDAVPTTAELSGFTKYMGSGGAGFQFMGTCTQGSTIITNTSSVSSSLNVGAIVFPNQFINSPIPATISLNTKITEIGSNFIKIDKPCLGNYTGQINATDTRVAVEGCIPYAVNGFMQWANTMGTTSVSSISPSLEFITDSDVVWLEFVPNGELTGPNQANVRVAVDDVYEQQDNIVVGGSRKWIKLTFANSRIRKVRIEFNDVYGVKRITGLNIKSNARLMPLPPKKTRIMFVGDSWGQSGAGALYGVHQNPTARMAIGLKASYVMGALDGSGYDSGAPFNLDNRALMCSLVDFDAIVFHGSLNDSGKNLGNKPMEAWSKHRLQAPNTPIFVYGVFPWLVSGTEVAAAALENQLKAQFALWNDPNSYFIPIATAKNPWIDNANRAGLFADGAHLNHNGTRYIAQMMAQAFSQIISGF